MEDGNINNPEAVPTAETRLEAHGHQHPEPALALPAAAVITRKIIVPAGQVERELNAGRDRGEQYIPFALEEVNLDFQVIGPAPNS